MRLRETYACCRGNRRKLAGEKGDALGQLHFSKRWQSTWESARRLSLPRNSHLLDPRKQSARKSQRGGKDKEAAATSRETMRAVVSVAVVVSTYGFAPARSPPRALGRSARRVDAGHAPAPSATGRRRLEVPVDPSPLARARKGAPAVHQW